MYQLLPDTVLEATRSLLGEISVNTSTEERKTYPRKITASLLALPLEPGLFDFPLHLSPVPVNRHDPLFSVFHDNAF